MPAPLTASEAMIIWDDKDPWGPEKHHRCIMCRGRLRPPLIVWHARVNDEEDDNGDDDFFGQRFICGPCAVWMCRGLPLDMKGIEKAKEVEAWVLIAQQNKPQ